MDTATAVMPQDSVKNDGDNADVDECIRHADPKHPDLLLCSCACAAYGKVCPHAKQVAQHVAAEAVASLRADGSSQSQRYSLFSSCNPRAVFHAFAPHELELGPKLGSGGYCQVHRVKVRRAAKEGNNHSESNDATDDVYYAVKFLKKQTMVDKKLFLEAATELAVEAHFLAALSSSDEHVVKLHGIVTDASLVGPNQPKVERQMLFLVMELLADTLEDRLDEWNRALDDSRGIWHVRTRLFSQEFIRQRREALHQRLEIAQQIARAMQYLHSRNVVYRDLKPANIGFTTKQGGNGNSNDVAKLFDFGVAKELPVDGTTSGTAGSLRYMAPEVALQKQYGRSVDVYSFGVLLFEVASLHKPFRGYDSNLHMQKVVIGGERPNPHVPWFPEALVQLIELCWSPIATNRPTFDEVVTSLESILQKMAEEALSTKEEKETSSWTKTAHILSYELFQ